MFTVENLTIETRKGRKLIENLSFALNDGDKMAIIGEEGNGKSTLLKALINPKLIADYCLVSGKINNQNCKIGYLEQKLSPEWDNQTIVDYYLKDTPDGDCDYDRYNDIFKFESILKNMGFDLSHINDNTLIKHLSGGEKVKLQLAKIYSGNYDVIFLDEPTNDLDIETLELLEKFILGTTKPVLYISHDETLLENTANRILHIEQLIKKTQPKFTLKKCTYDEYVEARNRQIDHQTQIAINERRERDKKEEILRQIKQKVENALVAAKKDPSSGRIIAKKMANVKAQERRLETEELTEIPDVEEAIKMIVDSTITLPSQKIVLEVKIPKLMAGDRELASNIELLIRGPQKIAIIGRNGCGKTTLIRKLVPLLKRTPGLRVGYFSQNYSDVLDYSKIALDEMQLSSRDFNAATVLGSLKFTREEMLHKVQDLSEGQKAKLALMKLIIEKNNVLVLDEPTRNLSPLSNPVVRGVLKKYNGAIITVSHDRKFIKDICDETYILSESGLKKNDFLERTEDGKER